MRRTVSMEHAKSILPTFPPPDIPTEEDDAEVEVTSFRTQPPSSDFSKPTQSKSYPQFCMPTSTPPSVFTHSQDLLLVTDTSIEPDTNNATTNTANTNSTSFTHVDNEKKLDVLSPSRSLEVPNSGSSTSLLSPRSVFSYDFNIPDNSNGIRLVASASELGGNKEIREDYWNATQTSMISSEALIPVQRESERSFFVEGSLESLEESERSNSSLMHPHCSEVPNDHASNSEGSSCEINYVHKRSFSADVLSADNDEQNDPKVETISHDRAHSQDSLPQTDPSQASYTSPDVPEIPRSVDEVHISGGSSNLDILNSSLEPLPDSPWVDDQLSPSRIFDFTDNRPRNHVDLPAISEETEQDPLPRSRELIELMKKSYNAEPFVCSPTTFSDKDESYNSPISSPPVPIHRRVVSDNHILYGNSNESVNRAEIRPREHLTRSGPVSSRCKSQVMLHKAEEHDESAKVDRNLSNSDPALNVEKDENEAPEVPSVPPPVVITRKNSSAQASSWQRFLPSGGANPHNVIIPTTANLPTRTIKRTESSVDNLKSDRSRVEKKKEKGSSDTFFGNWLGSRGRGKKSKERPSVDHVFCNYAGRNIQQSASFPVRRPGDSHRPAIPAFAEGLPDNISRVFSPTELDDVEPERTDLHSLLLENPKWSRLALFSDTEYQTWHEKYRHDKLSDKAIKKQDAIYELIMIERQHCANLVFLQQGYRMRLLEENILSQAEVNALIPDVIDALLLFHCNLLEQLLERQRSVDEIETISDILAKELSDEGTHTAVCINAYTTFGTSKQKAEQAYSILKVKNSKFNEILKLWETDKLYRRYEYKSIMAKIIGRPTKYRLLLETIARNESNKFSKTAECTEKAFQAAKRFALRIDQNLMVAQLARHWEKVRTHFDISSYTYLYIPDKASGFVRLKWTLDDICSEINENGRRLMCLGDVWWKVQSGGSCKLNPVTMALFDDILVLLVKKNTKMVFASTEQAVLPVSNLILRISGKGQSIMLASAVKPTLLEFEFHSKSDMAKWSSTLDTCINVVPTSVRLSSRNEDIISVQEEKKVKEEEEMWFRKLNKLFADRLDQERMLADYLVSRRKFLDEIRAHVFTLNCSGRSDLQERVREAIKVKFRDLKNYRTVPLNKMIDDITKARESELMNYFNNDFVDDADSDSSNSDSSSGKCVRPRRIKTFNGASGSVNNKEKLQLRRHTTVPRMSESSEAGIPGFNKNAEDEKREKEVVDEQIHLIPLSEPISSRRGCTRLIKDCERLKTENILLKNELALEKIRVTTLERGRPNFSPTVTAPGETMEALRKKEKEVREEDARRRSEIEEKRQEMAEAQAAFEQSKREWQEQMDRDKADLLRREQDIAEKWSKLKEAESRAGRLPVSTPTRIPFDKEPKTPPIQELSPLLKSLTVKSEPKRKK